MTQAGFESGAQCGLTSCTSTCPPKSDPSSDDEIIFMAAFWYYRNQTYFWDEFQNPSKVQCVPSGRFQWGFSYLVSLVFLSCNAVWAVGTYAVWIHMIRKSRMGREGREIGVYRVVMDMAEAIRLDLGDGIRECSEKEIERELASLPGVKYGVT